MLQVTWHMIISSLYAQTIECLERGFNASMKIEDISCPLDLQSWIINF